MTKGIELDFPHTLFNNLWTSKLQRNRRRQNATTWKIPLKRSGRESQELSLSLYNFANPSPTGLLSLDTKTCITVKYSGIYEALHIFQYKW